MSEPRPPKTTHLFTIRMWAEALDQEHAEWRGQVRYVTSGETRYFRDWPALVAFLREMLPTLDGGRWPTERREPADGHQLRRLEESNCP